MPRPRRRPSGQGATVLACALGSVSLFAWGALNLSTGNAVTAEPRPTATSTASAVAAQAAFVVFPSGVPAKTWKADTTAQADDPGTARHLATLPDAAWSADYQDMSDSDESTRPYVKVVGYARGLAEMTNPAETTRTDGKIAGRSAFWGGDPVHAKGDTYVVVALSPTQSVELRGYNLKLGKLRTFAGALRAVPESEWAAAH